MHHPCFGWTKLSIFPYWKEKSKNPVWICSAPSSPPETIKMLPGSQQHAEYCQMKMSTGSYFLILADNLEETAPVQKPPIDCPVSFSFEGFCVSKVNLAVNDNSLIIAFGWVSQNSYRRGCQLPQLLNLNFSWRNKCLVLFFLFNIKCPEPNVPWWLYLKMPSKSNGLSSSVVVQWQEILLKNEILSPSNRKEYDCVGYLFFFLFLTPANNSR